MSRARRTHFLKHPACGVAVRTFSCNIQTTAVREDVTCLVCLYHLGLYMPLVKLREHQSEQSWGRASYGKRDPFYAPPPTCMGCGRLLVPTAAGLRCPLGICCA